MKKIMMIFVASLLLSGCASDVGYLEMKKELSEFSIEKDASVYINKEVALSSSVDDSLENIDLKKEIDLVELRFKRNDSSNSHSFDDNLIDDRKVIKALSNDSSLSGLKEMLISRNPALKAAIKRHTATLNRYRQVASLSNIMAQYDAFILNANLSRQQSLGSPFAGTETLKMSIVAKDVEIAKLNIEKIKVKLISELEKNYASLLFFDALIVIEKENLRLLKELEELIYTGYGTGKKRFDYLIRVQMESAKLSNEVLSLESEKKTVVASINRYLSLPVDTYFNMDSLKKKEVYDLNGDLAGYFQIGVAQNQELMILQKKIKKSAIAISLGEKMAYPDLTQGLFETGDIKPAGKVNLWFGKNDAYLKEAEEKYLALEKEWESKKNYLIFEIKKTYLELDKSKRDIRLYKNVLIDQAKRTLDSTRIAYQAGNSDFIELLDTQVLWLKTNKGLIKAEKELDYNIANLKKLLGGSLSQGELLTSGDK